MSPMTPMPYASPGRDPGRVLARQRGIYALSPREGHRGIGLIGVIGGAGRESSQGQRLGVILGWRFPRWSAAAPMPSSTRPPRQHDPSLQSASASPQSRAKPRAARTQSPLLTRRSAEPKINNNSALMAQRWRLPLRPWLGARMAGRFKFWSHLSPNTESALPTTGRGTSTRASGR